MDIAGTDGEVVVQGHDDLAKRCQKYYAAGARFAKWCVMEAQGGRLRVRVRARTAGRGDYAVTLAGLPRASLSSTPPPSRPLCARTFHQPQARSDQHQALWLPV